MRIDEKANASKRFSFLPGDGALPMYANVCQEYAELGWHTKEEVLTGEFHPVLKQALPTCQMLSRPTI